MAVWVARSVLDPLVPYLAGRSIPHDRIDEVVGLEIEYLTKALPQQPRAARSILTLRAYLAGAYIARLDLAFSLDGRTPTLMATNEVHDLDKARHIATYAIKLVNKNLRELGLRESDVKAPSRYGPHANRDVRFIHDAMLSLTHAARIKYGAARLGLRDFLSVQRDNRDLLVQGVWIFRRYIRTITYTPRGHRAHVPTARGTGHDPYGDLTCEAVVAGPGRHLLRPLEADLPGVLSDLLWRLGATHRQLAEPLHALSALFAARSWLQHPASPVGDAAKLQLRNEDLAFTLSDVNLDLAFEACSQVPEGRRNAGLKHLQQRLARRRFPYTPYSESSAEADDDYASSSGSGPHSEDVSLDAALTNLAAALDWNHPLKVIDACVTAALALQSLTAVTPELLHAAREMLDRLVGWCGQKTAESPTAFAPADSLVYCFSRLAAAVATRWSPHRTPTLLLKSGWLAHNAGRPEEAARLFDASARRASWLGDYATTLRAVKASLAIAGQLDSEISDVGFVKMAVANADKAFSTLVEIPDRRALVEEFANVFRWLPVRLASLQPSSDTIESLWLLHAMEVSRCRLLSAIRGERQVGLTPEMWIHVIEQRKQDLLREAAGAEQFAQTLRAMSADTGGRSDRQQTNGFVALSGTGPGSWAAIQRSLRALGRTVHVLSLTVDPDDHKHVVALVITSTGVEHTSLILPVPVDQLVTECAQVLDYAPATPLGVGWDSLIAGLPSTILECDLLYVIPGEHMYGLPFHAFRRSVGGRWRSLVEDVEVAYCPSIRLLRTVLERPPRGDGRLTVLWGSQKEIRAAEARRHMESLPWERLRLSVLPPLAHLQTHGGSVLYLVGHGHPATEADGFSSTIDFGNGNTWTAADMMQNGPSAELVWLNSCELGHVLPLAGDITGFVAAILGAPNGTCIAAHQRIAATVAHDLAPRVLLRLDQAPQEWRSTAFTHLVREMILDPDWSHPHWWGPYFFWGDCRPLPAQEAEQAPLAGSVRV